MMKKDWTYRRGDIYYADLNPVCGSEQGGKRPVVVIQNDMGNTHAPTLIVATITTKADKRKFPTHYLVKENAALVEAHDANEVQTALHAGARVIGVNNRNLKDFSVDTDNSRRLRALIPHNVLFVSESGVSSTEDVAKLREIGADAVLIGETLMRASDKKVKLDELRGAV